MQTASKSGMLTGAHLMATATAYIFHYLPTGTYALNVLLGAIESTGHSSEVDIHLTKKLEDLLRTIDDVVHQKRRVFVFWSFFSAAFPTAQEQLAVVRGRFNASQVTHIAGGVHASAEPHQTLAAGFDYVAVGEGENIVVDLISATVGNGDIQKVKGLHHLRENVLQSPGPAERIKLDDYPPFAVQHRRFNPIEITRGCIYACRFCQTPFMFKARFRHRSIENICRYVREMKSFRLRDIRFITPTSLSYGSQDETVQLDQIEELLSAVREIVGSEGRIFFGSFPSEVRPEHVTPSAMQILKRYVDNDNIIIGGQSGSLNVLERSKRGHGVDDIERAVRYAVEAGFKPYVDFIFGLPAETETDAQLSLKFADRLVELGAKVHAHTFMPLPGTPFKDEPPGRISRKTAAGINRLTSRGGLYGNWQAQQGTARTLAGFRKAPTPSRLKDT
jgi:B12-binding domain/radical SAM domain protein